MVDTNELRRRCLNDKLDSLREAGADLDVHLEAEGLRRLRRHLQAPDKDLGFVSCSTHQEFHVVTRLVTRDHRGGVHQLDDLGDALV